MNEPLLDHRVKGLEEKTQMIQDELKELNRRVNSHDTSIAKIELLVEGLKADWVKLQMDIQKMIETQTTSSQHSTSAIKEVTIEIIKMTGIIVGAILGAKIFMG